MVIPKASDNLHAYKCWRETLEIIKPGTILCWVSPYPYNPHTPNNCIVEGQYLIAEIDQEPIVSRWDKTPAGRIVPLTRCTKAGKRYKKQFMFSMEGIAKYIDDGSLKIVE